MYVKSKISKVGVLSTSSQIFVYSSICYSKTEDILYNCNCSNRTCLGISVSCILNEFHVLLCSQLENIIIMMFGFCKGYLSQER